MHTNINITDSDHQYNYVIDYHSNVKSIQSAECSYFPCGLKVHDDDLDIHKIVLQTPGVNWYKNKNYWHKIANNGIDYDLPNIIHMSEVTLYFPEFSLDTYDKKTKYILSLDTWIHGHKIVLGSWLIRRIDALAADKPKTFLSQQYHECISVQFPDPYYLIYGDEWKNFRENVCGELYVNGNTMNNTGSIIYASLYAVEESDEGYIMKTGITGGQNSINISSTEDYLGLKISTNIFQPLKTMEEPSINYNLYFNSLYLDNLKEYLLETYNIEKYSIKYGLVIGSEDSLYLNIESDELDGSVTKYSFTKTNILSTGNFTNGNGFREGLYIMGSVDIIDPSGESLLYLLSNKIPFTQEVFKYFVNSNFEINGYIINNVNLNDVDMNVYNINAVNKIEQKIVQLNHHNDSKSNILQPVFFRAIETRDIIIHPAVTETISLNLDTYKSKVDTFKIRIEEIDFIESGRVANGVLFKIFGNKLPKKLSSGVYYILNESNELVTSGKYIYEV